MVEKFNPLQQPPGSNSCLPTAITTILQYHSVNITVGYVSDWCLELSDGCVIDLALDGLREHQYDVEELTQHSEEELRSYVNDTDDPLPILVTVKRPFSGDMDHAVVVLGFVNNGEEESVIYMDPITGQNERMKAEEFLRAWDFAGAMAFVIRP